MAKRHVSGKFPDVQISLYSPSRSRRASPGRCFKRLLWILSGPEAESFSSSIQAFSSCIEKVALYASELSEAKLILCFSEACLYLMKASEWDEELEFLLKEAAIEFATSFSVSENFPSSPKICWMVSAWVPLSFLTILKTFLSGVLWFTLLTSLRKEFLFACLITLRQSARAILKSAMSILFCVSIHFLRASFFFETARAQSSLNHTLFFRALLDKSGICFSAMSSRALEKQGMSVMVSWPSWLQSLSKAGQLAFEKLKKWGGVVAAGVSGVRMVGIWSEPCVSSRADHRKLAARSGLHMVRSMAEVLSE